MGVRVIVLGICLLAVGPSAALGQDQRYELGRRLKLFEAEWERRTDPADRARALKILPAASKQFLTLQLSAAARTLDDARFALRSADPPSSVERWAASLAVVPEKRLVDADTKELSVSVRTAYDWPGDRPKGVSARLRIGQGEAVDVPLTELPVTIAVPFPMPGFEGDQLVWLEIGPDGRAIDTAFVGVSTLRKLSTVLAFKNPRGVPAKGLDSHRLGIELATHRVTMAQLSELAGGSVSETDIPAARLLSEAQFFAFGGLFGGRYFRPRDDVWKVLRPRNQHWLTVPTAGDALTPCRIFVPPGLDPKSPVPVVVALHGVGGSENMYFEGYGAGCVVKACAARGWMVVCPRGGLGFLGGPPPVPEVVAALAERYPIDPDRVFLIGHSMGAAQTVDLVRKHPGTFAAVAVLGGGGKVRDADPFTDLPTFIGIGTADFARPGADKLRRELTAAGAKRVTFREYPDVDHLTIVRAAVADVFAGFDEIAGPGDAD